MEERKQSVQQIQKKREQKLQGSKLKKTRQKSHYGLSMRKKERNKEERRLRRRRSPFLLYSEKKPFIGQCALTEL